MGKVTRKTIIDFFADINDAVQELSLEDAGAVYRACTMYCASGEIMELKGSAKVIFLMLKHQFDEEKEHIEIVSKNRSHKKNTTANTTSDSDQMVPNGTKWYQMVSKEPNGSEEKESTLPPCPPSSSPTPLLITPYNPPTGKEKESYISLNGVEQEKKSRKSHDYYGSLSEIQRERFDMFWKAYPKKSTKQECASWWNDNKPDDELLHSILTGLEEYKKSKSVMEGFALDPIRFLKRRRWDDEIQPVQPSLFVGNNTKPAQKNRYGYDPVNGFSEEAMERMNEKYRKLAQERGEL